MLFGDLAQYSDGETRAGERMSPEKIFGDPHVAAYRTNFVFEKLPERLDEGQVHTLGQAPHVMVTFDYGGRPAHGDGFDNVRVQSALDQIFDSAQPVRFPLENLYKNPADDPPLLLRIDDAFQRAEKLIRGLDADHVEAHLLPEQRASGFELTLLEKPCIHEDAHLLFADRLVDERRRDRRVDPAGETTDDLLRADLTANFGDLFADNRLG